MEEKLLGASKYRAAKAGHISAKGNGGQNLLGRKDTTIAQQNILKYSWSGQVDHSDQLSERLQVSFRLLYKCCEDSKMKILLSVIYNYSFNYRQVHSLSCHGQLKTHWVCCKLVPTGAVVALVPSPEETLGGGLWGILFQTSC